MQPPATRFPGLSTGDVTVVEEVLTCPELSVPVELVHYDQTRTRTRGKYRKLGETPAQLQGPFSKSGPNVWVPTPKNTAEVSHVVVNGATWRALDSEQVGVSAAWVGTSTRYQLIPA